MANRQVPILVHICCTSNQKAWSIFPPLESCNLLTNITQRTWHSVNFPPRLQEDWQLPPLLVWSPETPSCWRRGPMKTGREGRRTGGREEYPEWETTKRAQQAPSCSGHFNGHATRVQPMWVLAMLPQPIVCQTEWSSPHQALPKSTELWADKWQLLFEVTKSSCVLDPQPSVTDTPPHPPTETIIIPLGLQAQHSAWSRHSNICWINQSEGKWEAEARYSNRTTLGFYLVLDYHIKYQD